MNDNTFAGIPLRYWRWTAFGNTFLCLYTFHVATTPDMRIFEGMLIVINIFNFAVLSYLDRK